MATKYLWRVEGIFYWENYGPETDIRSDDHKNIIAADMEEALAKFRNSLSKVCRVSHPDGYPEQRILVDQKRIEITKAERCKEIDIE